MRRDDPRRGPLTSKVDLPYPAGAVRPTTRQSLERAVSMRGARLTEPRRGCGIDSLASSSDASTRQPSAPPRVSPRSRSDPRQCCRATQRRTRIWRRSPARRARNGPGWCQFTQSGMRPRRVPAEMAKERRSRLPLAAATLSFEKGFAGGRPCEDRPGGRCRIRGPATAAGQSEDLLTAIRRPGATRGRRFCAGFPDLGSGRGASWGLSWRRSSWSPRWAR